MTIAGRTRDQDHERDNAPERERARRKGWQGSIENNTLAIRGVRVAR